MFDFESSHETPAEGGLVEIAYCDLVSTGTDLVGEPALWEVAGGKGRLCNPGVAIPPDTSAIHQIIDEDVAAEPFWQSLLASIIKRSREDGVMAFAGFGMRFEALWMHPDWRLDTPLVCVYKAALRIWPESPLHSNMGLRYWRRPEGLDRATALPAHRAYPDAYVTAFHLRDMLNSGTPLHSMIEWTKVPALTIRCRIGDYRNGGRGTPWADVETSMLRWILNKQSFDEDTVFTAEHHLALREAADNEARERRILNQQLVAEGKPPQPELGPVPAQKELL